MSIIRRFAGTGLSIVAVVAVLSAQAVEARRAQREPRGTAVPGRAGADARDDADRPLRFRRLQQQDEHGDVPADGLIRAKRHVDQMRRASPVKWTWLGPGKRGGGQFYGAAGNVLSGTIVGGTKGNGTLRYAPAEGPEAFTRVLGGDGGQVASDPGDPDYFYGEYPGLGIFRSSNGGESPEIFFGNAIPDFNRNSNFIAPFILDPSDPQTLLAGGESLWRTSNAKFGNPPGFRSIKAPAGSLISAIAIAPGNSDICWVGHNDGSVYKAIDCTAPSPAWNLVDTNSPGLPNRMVMRLTIDPSDPAGNRVYAAFGGFSANNIWRTTDGGGSWSSVGGAGLAALPEVPVHDLEVFPFAANWLFAATEVGVFTSQDAGLTWRVPQDGPANVIVSELFWMVSDASSPAADLVAATFGQGLFKASVFGGPFVTQSSAPLASGTGAAVPPGPVATFSSTSLSFGLQSVGTTSAPQAVTLTNAGSAPLNVLGLAVSGDDFPVHGNTCEVGFLSPGASCVVAVRFAPHGSGIQDGSILITTDGADGQQLIELSGIGVRTSDMFFSDDLEVDVPGWSRDLPWSLTTETAHSGSRAWSDSPDGTYGPNLNVSIWSPVMDLTGTTAPLLTFWHKYQFAADGFDSGNVWVTTDFGNRYTLLTRYAGTNPAWSESTIDLSAYAGAAWLRVVFQVVSNATLSGDGWYIDDVVVTNGPPGSFGKLRPLNGATERAAARELPIVWQTSPGASNYEYCYDTSDNNTCDTSWRNAGTPPVTGLNGLAAGTTYFWQARARRGAGTIEADDGTWWSFTTTFDVTPPSVISVTPVNGATGVGTGTSLTATFSEVIDGERLSSGFRLLDPAGAIVNASITFTEGTAVARLTPWMALAASTTYTGRVREVTDLVGNEMPSSVVWFFTTHGPTTVGLKTIGSALDSSDSHFLNGSKVTTTAAGQVTSMSVYVGNLDSVAANRQYQLAIYTDTAGRPGTLVGVSATGTLVANSWNPLPVSASLAGNTNYWLMYNTNGRSGSVNNMYYNSGAAGQGAYSTASVPFGTWPATFPPATINHLVFSLFATFGLDTTPPSVTGVTPANGATGVSAATAVTATFSEAIQTEHLTSAFQLRDPMGQFVASTITFDAGTRVARLTPSAPLDAGAVYTATVTGAPGGCPSCVRDLAGNPLPSPTTWSFSTGSGDTTPPTVTSVSPANGTTGVTVASLTATFSEAIDPATITTTTFVLRDSANTVWPATVSYDATTGVARLTRSVTLTELTMFTATITGGSSGVKDLAGNPLAGNFVWSFTTADPTPPTVIGVSPANGATGVAVSALTAMFSEGINPATLTTATFVLRNPANAVVPATVSYTAATRTGTLTPSSALSPSTTYTATITGGSTGVADAAGNRLDVNFVWSFTTAGTALTLGSTTIGTGLDSSDSNFLNGSKVTTTAPGHVSSMSVYVGTVDSLAANRLYQLAIYTESAGRPGALVAASASGTLVANAWNTLPVSASLLGSVNYWLMFNTNGRTGTVNNMRYNTGAAGQGAYSTSGVTFGTWPATFPAATTSNLVFSLFATLGTDTTAPTVISVTPLNGATGVSTAAVVTATFSEAINTATLTATTFVLRDPANAVVPATVSYNAAQRAGTLTPSTVLAAGSIYTVTILGGSAGVKDVAGNPLASNVGWSFTTAAGAPVTVGSTAIGSSLDSGDSNYLNGSKVATMTAGQIASMSVYVGAVDSLVANRQYQLAVYTDVAGRPGTRVAVSATGTLVPNAWNTLTINAALLAGTNYWLMFNTNGRTGPVNNMRYNTGAARQGAYSNASVPFGTWPATFPAATMTNFVFSLFATFGP